MKDIHPITKKCAKCNCDMHVGKDEDGHIAWYCKKCKEEFDYDLVCPVCGNDDFSEVTGWCPNYSEPLIEGQCITGPSRPMCCGVIFNVEDVFYCSEPCDTFFSYDEYIDWNDIMGYAECPIGSFDIKNIIARYDQCIEDAEKILGLGFEKIALVFIVTSFEILSKELFIRSYKNWFFDLEDWQDSSEDDKINYIIDIIEKIRHPDLTSSLLSFLHTFKSNNYRKANRGDTVDFLMNEIFIENMQKYENKINFNRMSDRGSFPWLYKHFLDIDVIREFQKEGDDKWTVFREFVIKRHRIIHNYSISIKKEYVEEGKKITGEIVKFIHKSVNSIERHLSNKLF